jgi:hypothetical protein
MFFGIWAKIYKIMQNSFTKMYEKLVQKFCVINLEFIRENVKIIASNSNASYH